MIYYRVNPAFDNTVKYKRMNNSKYLVNDGSILIGNELYTEKEYNRMIENYVFRIPVEKLFSRVEISKRRVYWFFGARFEIDNGYKHC